MKLKSIYQYLILLHCVAFIACENYYTIIAPGVLKSNRKYSVAVTLHDSNAPCTISISILGRLFNVTDQVELQPFETKKLDFFPPKLDGSDYELLAKGIRGCYFRNQTKLFSAANAGPKIYIQTDKAVYKPLDLVQFRIAILDEHTRPLNVREPIRVEIFDKDKNRVKQFKDIALTKGVFKSKFNLSQQPVTGEWEIRVILSGKYSHQNSKKFSVQSYTLPKFEIFVETPLNVIGKDNKIRAEIYGKYIFDKYVEGSLLVELRTGKQNDSEVIAQQSHQIDGLLVVEFQLENLENRPFLYLFATIEEKHTGHWRSSIYYIRIHKERYLISIPHHAIEFRNNKPFRLKAHVKDWTYGRVWDPKTPVTLEHGSRQYKTFLNDEGTAVFEFDHQDNTPYTVIFKESKIDFNIFQLYKQREGEVYCELKLKESPRLGKPVEVEVRSSFNIPYLVYTVVGHASVVRIEYIKVPAYRKKHTIKITPSIEMIPVSFLYVHYILDGNLRYEELTLNFPMELENQISIKAPKKVKPGNEVRLKVKAEPKSYVSVLAVDLGVYILDHSYDIYKSEILEDLKEDRSYVPNANIGRPGILSGVVTLTNAHHPIYNNELNIVSPDSKGVPVFREKFPETWIFENYEIDDTDTEIVLNIPDTITNWRITAFSTNAVKGFGVVDGPTDINTFMPFFITLNLPFKVKRDEIVTIPVTIFNYHNQTADTEVTLHNKYMQFRFMEPLSKYSPRDYQTKSMEVPANGGMTVKFLIKLLQIAEIEIRVTANSSLYTDGVVQHLNVELEGITKYQNKARYLSAVDTQSSLSLDIPLDSVSDSEVITLSVGSDFMIPSLENLNEMVNLPTGCGEQNMMNFAPNILILDYLKATGKSRNQRKLVSDAKSYADIGYQQQMSYRHKNGGYSVFGEGYSQEASTWLTAYVVRYFIKAAKYTPIETRIIDADLEYLAQKQFGDGSFPYTDYLFYQDLQNKYGFTAFVLLTFMEDHRYSRKYRATINKGLDYISSNLDKVDDVYSLSIIVAALTKAKHTSSIKALQNVWWSGLGTSVESTAYTLLASLNLPGNHLPVLKWLIEQRNSRGGFKSTQDTVVGLEALTTFAQKYNNAGSLNMKVSYAAQDQEGNTVKRDEFWVTRNNALILQQHELPKSVRRINFQITGNGYSLVQLSSQFNIKRDSELKHFVMKVNPIFYNFEELDLEVCFTYYALQEVNNSTNMVIMEANLPSGFKIEPEYRQRVLGNDFIQRIESRNDETTAILYFDKLSTDTSHCVIIEIFRANEVTEPKPASIVMYDYYETNWINTLLYTI